MPLQCGESHYSAVGGGEENPFGLVGLRTELTDYLILTESHVCLTICLVYLRYQIPYVAYNYISVPTIS